MQAEDLYRFVVENSELAAYWLDCEGVFRYVSPAAGRLFGYAASEVLGQGFPCFTHPEDLPYARMVFQQVLAGEVTPFELRVLSKSGAFTWVRITASRVYSQGQLAGVVGFITDVTEHKRAAAALHETEDRYRDLCENSQDLLCTHDLQGRLLWVNSAAARLIGYRVEELVGAWLPDFLDAKFREQFDQYLALNPARPSGVGADDTLHASG